MKMIGEEYYHGRFDRTTWRSAGKPRFDRRGKQVWLNRAEHFPKLPVSNRTVSDLFCIATGVFSPLTGF